MKGTRRATRDARRLYRRCLVNGTLDEVRARRVAQAISRSGRRGAIALLSAFHRLVQLDHDRHSARVESATPLDGVLKEHIVTGLQRRYGGTVVTTFTENPELLGGVRIRVGSDVYDGSVRGRLAALVARL